MTMSGDLAGKIAVVTGSTQGLGAGIARAFVKQGARVVIAGRSREKGQAVLDSLGPGNAVFQQADLANPADCKQVIAAGMQAFGGVDILVNSAGDTSRCTLEDLTPELFDQLFHVNVRAPLLLAQAALPSLRERKGVIINIGSVNAYVGLGNLLAYASTKGALMTASKNLANALAFARVRVFVLNIGWADTDGERVVLAREGKDPGFIEREGKAMPIGRLLKPEDVAEVCLLLASNRSAAFSGSVIDLEQFPLGSLRYPTGSRNDW